MFSIRDLRDIILQQSRFVEDVPTEGVEAVKQVGIRKVSAWEVARAKRCAYTFSRYSTDLAQSSSCSRASSTA